MGVAMVIFRCDMLVLVASMALVMLLGREISFLPTLLLGVGSCSLALAISLLIDSFFWQQWMWPEGYVLYFNTVENRSSEWGVFPFYWYFLIAIPKSLQLVLVWIGILFALFSYFQFYVANTKSEATNQKNYNNSINSHYKFLVLKHASKAFYYLSAPLLFISLYSILPHKELRFVLPVFPLFTVPAAVSMDLCMSVFLGNDIADKESSYWFPLSQLAFPKQVRPTAAPLTESSETAVGSERTTTGETPSNKNQKKAGKNILVSSIVK
jgi:alpha-1,6-mannosyltransferase